MNMFRYPGISFKLSCIYGFLLALLPACQPDPDMDDIPAYLYMEPFTLVTSPTQGSNATRITEAWLTVEGQFLGAYRLPGQAPILERGEREISLFAGIKDNGLAAVPEIYPFYTPFRTTISLQPNIVDTLRPVVSYDPDTRFAFIDDFERGAPLLGDLRIGTDINRLRPSDADVFEGRFSGRIYLDTLNPVVEIGTLARYRGLTDRNPAVYLEVNYRSEVPVVWGVIGYQDGSPATDGTPIFEPGFLAREDWNKIYFNLSTLFVQGNFDEYQIALRASIPRENNVFTLKQAEIWLDNIKLVHF